MEGARIRKQEKLIDDQLNIQTIGLREWRDNELYHRCEPTPYRALENLTNNYKLTKFDNVVDFGCGRGRVAFYMHHKFGCNIKGIEANDLTFDEALKNLNSYNENNKNNEGSVSFIFGTAENYNIKKEDNIFYFFNPFGLPIFINIMYKIIKDLEVNPRKVDVIIYYSIPEYIKFMEEHSPFKLKNKIGVPNKKDKYQEFYIYSFDPETI